MYYLQAIISLKEHFNSNFINYDIIELNHNFAMIPLSKEFIIKTGDIRKWAEEISRDTIIAYVDAEFFMGIGGVKIDIYGNGILIKQLFDSGTSIHEDTAVCAMLEHFGFIGEKIHPAFEAGLLKHNRTEDWLKLR